MAAINPISGSVPAAGVSPIARGAQQPQAPAGKANFAEALKTYVGGVDQQQQDDILPVVSAVAKADMSFKLLVGVRNKVIEAYKQTMNMQV